MQRILEALDSHARRPHAPPALEGRERALGYGELARAVERTAARLRRDRVRVVALALPNTPAWVVADLAAAAAGCAVVPIPPFFTSAQARHALEASGAELLLTLHPEAAAPLLPPRPVWLERHPVAGEPVAWLHLDGRGGELPAGAAKVTFTSGTTGEPKGVVLAGRALGEVAVSLAAAAEGRAGDRHLCLSPLAVLLENVAGVYAPLLAGATVRLASPEESGLAGGASVDGHRLARCLAATGATSAILTPGPLQALTAAVAAEGLRLPALRFLAVGGAPVSRTLLARATALGLPVYE
ncbi:MAG: long-chain acyl-CoA synthetase, partial [Nitrospirae bacterium]